MGVGEMGQIIGEMGVGKTVDQPVYRPGWTDLWTDIVSCPSIFNINITIKTGKPQRFMDGTSKTETSPIFLNTLGKKIAVFVRLGKFYLLNWDFSANWESFRNFWQLVKFQEFFQLIGKM